ncbi:plastocyanin/azurin family copper-binding protein [Halobaculum litoreum]|uniref:plastocyanin/azurin family copper-binding protein n=1 Tax=Halobaculum litoreum TaxID=3031998 RepID=UPI0024C24B6D|nr:plastocyanin/azurin family copper-binding protein [Halobaculum sp. DT92]
MRIHRRELLRLAAAASAATATAFAGCTGGGADAGDDAASTTAATPTATATPEPTPTPSPTAESTPTAGATEVAVGPEGRLRFVPDLVEIGVDDTVVWTFESPGHNVSSLPSADSRCSNPEGAEPFASYEGEQHFAILPPGATFEHTFTVPGEYVYVCVPHAGQGMIGTVRVSE